MALISTSICVTLSDIKHLLKRLLVNLTPLIPLSILGEGEEVLERGLCPLSYLHSPFP